MTDLPNREKAQRLLDQRPRPAIGGWYWDILQDVADGELKTRDEMDVSAAWAVLREEMQRDDVRSGLLYPNLDRVMDTAFGDGR